METAHARETSSMSKLHPVSTFDSSIADRFSLVTGGPFYRALVRMRLAEPLPNLRLRTAVFVLLTWVPLLALTLVDGTAIGSKVGIALLRDFSVYGRFLLGLPLLIVAEAIIDPWIQRVVSTFNTSGLVRDEDRPAYYAALAKTKRLEDSALAEFIIALLAAFPLFLLFESEWRSNGVTAWHGSTSGGLSPAGWWFTFVSSPIIRFIIFRWLWRYALWTGLLYKIAKLNLNMMPVHPDHFGGLGFVVLAQKFFGILFMAIGCFMAGQFANSIVYFGMPFVATNGPMVAYVVLSVVLVVAPLTTLSPRLAETRRNGLTRYDQTGRHLTGAFDAKWGQRGGPLPDPLLGSSDPSTVIDYVSSYEVIYDIQVIPVTRELVIQVAALAAAPLVLIWILLTPVEQIVAGLFKMVL